MNPRTELDQGVWEILVMAQVAAEVAKGNLSFIYASVMEAILLPLLTRMPSSGAIG
jgi:hypothetical protein